MVEYIRQGIDPDVVAGALASSPPIDESAEPVPVGASDAARHVEFAGEPLANARVGTIVVAGRRVIRRMLAVGFRFARPVAKPVALRTRRFMNDDVHLALALDTNHIAHQVELARTHLQLHLDARLDGAVAEFVRQQQAESVAIRRDVFELVNALRSDLDRSSDHGAQVVLSTIAPRLDRLEAYTSTMIRRVVVPLGDRELMIQTPYGYVLCSTGDASTIAGLIDTGDIERGTRLLIEHLLVRGATLVDVGANVGVHALAGARAVGPTGTVIAIEPFPPTVRLLRRAMEVNGHAAYARVIEAAAGRASGTAELHLGTMSGHHSLIELTEGEGDAVQVPVAPLDELVPPEVVVDVLKIDVEGAELDVLRGATRVLADSPDVAVVAEFGVSHLVRAGISVADWFSVIDEMGFRWMVIDPIEGTLSAATPEEVSGLDSANLLMARPDSAVWARAQMGGTP